MTTPLAWLTDMSVVSEMLRPRPEPRVAAFLDSVADEGLGLATISIREVLDGSGRPRDLAVVTRNAREFRNTGVQIGNPWTIELRSIPTRKPN